VFSYANEHDGKLDVPAVDRLVKQGDAKIKTVKVESGEAGRRK
jgi:hypothetical protein